MAWSSRACGPVADSHIVNVPRGVLDNIAGFGADGRVKLVVHDTRKYAMDDLFARFQLLGLIPDEYGPRLAKNDITTSQTARSDRKKRLDRNFDEDGARHNSQLLVDVQ